MRFLMYIVQVAGWSTLCMVLLLLVALGMLGLYCFYDYIIKKLLGWKDPTVRKDVFYFIKHKKEIREYIKNKNFDKQIRAIK